MGTECERSGERVRRCCLRCGCSGFSSGRGAALAVNAVLCHCRSGLQIASADVVAVADVLLLLLLCMHEYARDAAGVE